MVYHTGMFVFLFHEFEVTDSLKLLSPLDKHGDRLSILWIDLCYYCTRRVMLVQKYKYIHTWVFYNQEYFLPWIWSLSQLRYQNHGLAFTCLPLLYFVTSPWAWQVLEKYLQVSLGTYSCLWERERERELVTGVFTSPRPRYVCCKDFG